MTMGHSEGDLTGGSSLSVVSAWAWGSSGGEKFPVAWKKGAALSLLQCHTRAPSWGTSMQRPLRTPR